MIRRFAVLFTAGDRALKFERYVPGDAEQPRVKRLRLLQFVQREEGPHERLLRRLPGEGAVAEPARHEGEHRSLLTFDEEAEIVGVPVATTLHIFPVGEVHDWLGS